MKCRSSVLASSGRKTFAGRRLKLRCAPCPIGFPSEMPSNQETTAIFVIEEEDETARRGFSFEKKQKSSSESSDIRELFFSVTPKPRARQCLRRRSIVASCQRCYLEGGALARLAKRISLRGHLNLKSNHSSQNGSEGRQSKRLFIFLTLSGVRRRTKWQPHRRSCHLAGQVMLLTAKQF